MTESTRLTTTSEADHVLVRRFEEVVDRIQAGEPLDAVLACYPEHADQLRGLAGAVKLLAAGKDGMPPRLRSESSVSPSGRELVAGEGRAAGPGRLPRPFGSYELLEKLGGGGQADVYRARHLLSGKEVALKVIRADQEFEPSERRRLLREAQILANVKHEHIVPVYDVGECGGRLYFTMDLVPSNLLARLAEYRLPEEAARSEPGEAVVAATRDRLLRLMAKLARALRYLHERGFIHRDIKPSNVLLDSRAEPLVADLGIAYTLGTEVTGTEARAVIGTLPYMAPEQATGREDQTWAVDVWALGVMFYELLTGQKPFRGADPLEVWSRITDLETKPEPPSTVNLNVGADSDLELICLKCLEKDPRRRYESAAALAEDLERAARGDPISLRPESFLEHTLRALRHRRPVDTHSWRVVEYWDAVLSLVLGGAAYALIRADVSPAWLWLLLLGYMTSVWTVLLPAIRRPVGRQTMHTDLLRLWQGHALACLILAWIHCPPFGERRAADFLPFFPGCLLLTGMVFLVQGRMYWGWLYLLGLAYFAAAALLPLWWDGASLTFGVFNAACMIWLGLQPGRRVGSP